MLEGEGVVAVAEETVSVVVVEEGEDIGGIGVELVIDKDIVHTVHAAPPVVGLLVTCLRETVEEGEVHDGVEVCVLVVQAAVLL